MSKILDISDKLATEKPQIRINGKDYCINDGVDVVLKFEELLAKGGANELVSAIKLVLGKEAAAELEIDKMPLNNFKALIIGITATVQGIEYEEVESRFQDNLRKQ